jgi:hypothetical protein
MGFPAMRARDFPGKREEANRAGITPRILVGTIDLITVASAVGKILFRAAEMDADRLIRSACRK